MTEHEIVDIVRGVHLSTLSAMTDLPPELTAKVEAMMSLGATVVDVATVLAGDGYSIVIMAEEVDVEEPDDMVEMDYMESEDDMDLEMYDDDRGGLVGLLDRLRAVFGKAVSFERENALISRNRKRASARAPHDFQRAVWATRKGTIRCRVCGGPSPVEGQLCAGITLKDMGEMYDDGLAIGDLTIRSATVAQAYDMIADTLGCWSPHEAHYIEDNPFVDEGLACMNCVAYCPETAGCYWVDGPILPDALCKLWVIPETLHRPVEYVEKEIVQTGGRFEVRSADGATLLGTYDTRAEAEARLAQVEQFSKADTYTPPDGVREEAKRAEAWIAEGHAGDGFTATGRRRAADLAAGNPMSLDTIKRMASYLARHEVDKQGEGWSPGETGYPSPGRVAWAAWGGDPAVSWTRGILDDVDKASPSVSDVHVDVPMGSGSRSRRRLVSPTGMMSKEIGVGSYVSWDSSGGRARGRVERISTDRPIAVPDSSFSIDASEDDPAALIRLWEETPDGWRATDRRVGHRLGTLTEIDALERSIPSVFAKADERRFTLGPWYVPDAYDAHGEWTDATELQSALWDYVRNSDRQIRLQHNVEVVAGEWVEAMTWPYAVTVPMLDVETDQVTDHEFPANTVFMGVVWEPWAWDLVKAGKIRGYSMGGNGQRVTVDLPSEGQL